MADEKERTEYVQLMVDRYHNVAYNADGSETAYETHEDYLFLLNAPRDYQVEPEMLEYAKAHPDATIKELSDYFDTVASEGLPPGDDGADLME